MVLHLTSNSTSALCDYRRGHIYCLVHLYHYQPCEFELKAADTALRRFDTMFTTTNKSILSTREGFGSISQVETT